MMDDSGDNRRFPARPIVGVGAVAFDGDRVLLVKRGHEPLKGEWSLPGGCVEVGETLEEAVAREVLEETGLKVDVGPVVEVLDRIRRAADGAIEHHFVIIDYLCRVREGALAHASDADDVRWVAVSELPKYRVTEKATEVIRRAFSDATRNRPAPQSAR
jgi:mutator protein MutT